MTERASAEERANRLFRRENDFNPTGSEIESEIEAAERAALEEACRLMCRYCAEGVPAESQTPTSSAQSRYAHVWPGRFGGSCVCWASPIRARLAGGGPR